MDKFLKNNSPGEFYNSSIVDMLAVENCGIIFRDKNGAVTDINRGALDVFGCGKKEILNTTGFNYLDAEENGSQLDVAERLEKGESFTQIETIKNKINGNKEVCIVSYSPVFNVNKEINGSVAIFHDITEIKKQIEKEKNLETTLSNLFENLSSAFCLYELVEIDGKTDMIIVKANQAFSDWIGIPCEQLAGRLFTEVCAEDMDYFASYVKVAKGGESRTFEAYSYFLKRNINGTVYSPAKGQVAIVMIDRTQAVEAEQALRARENDLSLLFTSMTSGFCMGKIIWDEAGNASDIFFEIVNKAFEEMEDFEHGSLQDKRLSEVMPGKSDPYMPIYVEVVENKNKRKFHKYIETRNVTLDVVCYSPKEDYFVCLENDVSERLRAEKELQKAYEDTEAILHVIPAPICVVNKNSGLILDCNAAFMAMCSSREKADIIKSPIAAYFKAQEGTGGFDAVQWLHRGVNFNCFLEKADDTFIEIEVFSRPFIYRDSEAFAVYCLDITEQKSHEEVLRKAAYEAEEASRMKTNFLANMSHEIRTPMNGIIGFIDLALDSEGVPDKVREYLSSIKISAGGLLDILNDVLDIAKIEAGKMELEKTIFDINSIFAYCERVVAPKAHEKGVCLYLFSEPTVGKKLIGDPTKLNQILLNLLSNAIKFTNFGYVRLVADVVRDTGRTVTIRFEVKDSGIGMSQEQTDKITEPFMQADTSTTRKYGGTGLGLTITNNLIELMGGRLEIESIKNIGSRFIFELTFEAVKEYDLEKDSAADSGWKGNKPVFNATALVCEDNPINQLVIKEHLLKIGITPTIAENGYAGVHMLKEGLRTGHPFDVILMDINMPVMDGLEATKKMYELGNEAPIIAMTANVMTMDRERYMAEGMSDYLAKPFNPKELWACLMKYLKPVDFVKQEMEIKNEPAPEQIVVVDKKLGIERTAGDENLYRSIVVEFITNNSDFINSVDATIKNGDIEVAHRMAHTFKSVAATIGAQRLSKTAANLEAELAGGNKDIPVELLSQLDNELSLVVEELIPYVKDKLEKIEHKEKADKTPEQVDFKKSIKLVAKLEKLLKHGNSECMDYLEDIDLLLSPLGSQCETLLEQIDDFEYDMALETLTDIKQYLLTEYAKHQAESGYKEDD